MENLKNIRKFSSFHKYLKEFRKGHSIGNIDTIILFYIMDFIDYCGSNKSYGGNTIKIDKRFKSQMMDELGVNQDNISQALHLFYKVGILYKIKNGLYQFNPWLAARGSDTDVKWLRRYGVFYEIINPITGPFRKSENILKIMKEDMAQSKEEIEESEIPIPECEKIYKVLFELNLITKKQYEELLNQSYEEKRKNNPEFENLKKKLRAAERRI